MHQFTDGAKDGLLDRLRHRARAGRAGYAIDSSEECAKPEGQRVLLLPVRWIICRSGDRGLVHVAIAVSHFVYRVLRGGFIRVGDMVHGGFAEAGLSVSMFIGI